MLSTGAFPRLTTVTLAPASFAIGLGANASHGLRRTNEDKRRAVVALLGHEE